MKYQITFKVSFLDAQTTDLWREMRQMTHCTLNEARELVNRLIKDRVIYLDAEAYGPILYTNSRNFFNVNVEHTQETPASTIDPDFYELALAGSRGDSDAAKELCLLVLSGKLMPPPTA